MPLLGTLTLTSSTGDVAYCPSVKKLVFLSRNSSNYPEIFYGTVSGTSVSYSTYDTYGNGYSGDLRLAFKPTGGVGLMTGCVSSNNYGAYITITTVSTNYPQFVTQSLIFGVKQSKIMAVRWFMIQEMTDI